MTASITDTAIDDRFYDALAAGDVEAARACFTPDAAIWHSFDGIAQDLATAAAGWRGLCANSTRRQVHDVRRSLTQDGQVVRRHVMVIDFGEERRMAWPVCLILTLDGGLIARLDEYMDRAGSFTPGEGAIVMPGH